MTCKEGGCLGTRFQYRIQIVGFLTKSLSPPQRPLCVMGSLGRGEKSKRVGGDGKGPPAALNYCYFYWNTQREPLRRREPKSGSSLQ